MRKRLLSIVLALVMVMCTFIDIDAGAATSAWKDRTGASARMDMMSTSAWTNRTAASVHQSKMAASVRLNKTAVSLDEGKTITLKLQGAAKKTVWKSSDKNVASVTAKEKNGLKAVVKTVGEGEAVITATCAKKKYTCSVTVTAKETTLTYTQISQEEAMQMMAEDDGHVVVDVRREDEYAAGHIPGAILIPNETIGTEKPDALPDLDQIILVYCRSGNRSKQASEKLAAIGYKHVYEFGGIITWPGAITTDTTGSQVRAASIGRSETDITTVVSASKAKAASRRNVGSDASTASAKSKKTKIDKNYNKIELTYNSHIDSRKNYNSYTSFTNVLIDPVDGADYTIKIKDNKVVKKIKNTHKDTYPNDRLLLCATGIGKTTGIIYEKTGKKWKKVGPVKIVVKEGSLGDGVSACMNSADNVLPNPICLMPYLNKNTYDLGATIEGVLNSKEVGTKIKKSEYKISYSLSYDVEDDTQVPEEKKTVSINDKGVITALRTGASYVQFEVKFKDKSNFSWNLTAEVLESSIEKNGIYNINNIRNYIVGIDTQVPLTGEGVSGTATQICFDNAATTPAFKPVEQEVHDKLEMYGSIGRGFSEKSNYSTDLYMNTRNKVLDFLGADRGEYTCFYTNSTTDGLNKLASALITSKKDVVLTTRIEHHANDLSWRERCKVIYAEVDKKGRVKYDEIEKLLKKNKVKIVSISAASNVTGYVVDVHRVAKMAHKYGALIVVDGAQIVAHRQFSMMGDVYDPSDDIDFIAFSAHKMYSPYGGGAVAGRAKELYKHMPTFYGGGTVQIVGDNWVDYKENDIAVYEAGSPNYPGVVGLGKAIDVISDVGFDAISEHEKRLNRRVIDGLKKLPNIILYGDSENIDDRVGVVTFNFSDINTQLLAEQLSGLGAVATRRGQFCAHPYVWRLMGIPDSALKDFEGCASAKTPGMVRVSFGIYNTEEEVDKFLEILPVAMEAAKKQQERLDAVPEY